MKFIFNPIYGTLEVSQAGEVSTIESSKITPMSGIIPATSSAIIDSITYTGFFAIRYFVATQSSTGITNTFDYSIANGGSSTIKEVVFGQIFGGLDLNVSSFVDSGLVKFTITNNESVSLTYKVHKLGF